MGKKQKKGKLKIKKEQIGELTSNETSGIAGGTFTVSGECKSAVCSKPKVL
jgi:uncharacterized protein YjbJ (UPF0337 family)